MFALSKIVYGLVAILIVSICGFLLSSVIAPILSKMNSFQWIHESTGWVLFCAAVLVS